MCRTAEDRAAAVFHEHEIRDIDGQLPTGNKRMKRFDTGVESFLLRRFENRFARAHPVGFGDESGERRIAACEFLRQRMTGRDRAEGGAEEGIGTRGEDLEPVGTAAEREKDASADRKS